MAAAFHTFPNYTLQAFTHNTNQIDLSGGTVDTLKVLLIASGTYTWGATPETQTTVTQFLAGDGTHGALTEVSGTGYSRQTLTGVSLTNSGEVTTLTCANPSWPSSTFSAVYALFYDYTAGGGSDTNGLCMCYWDFGGTQTVTGATFLLTIGAGLITWTNS